MQSIFWVICYSVWLSFVLSPWTYRVSLIKVFFSILIVYYAFILNFLYIGCTLIPLNSSLQLSLGSYLNHFKLFFKIFPPSLLFMDSPRVGLCVLIFLEFFHTCSLENSIHHLLIPPKTRKALILVLFKGEEARWPITIKQAYWCKFVW